MSKTEVLLAIALLPLAGQEDLANTLTKPTPESRILMRWWWFGPAVTPENLEHELLAMKAAGIGGVEIQPVYPLTLDDPASGLRNHRFLSTEFLAALRFAATQGRELGLRIDVTLGSGWPFGGPAIPRELAAYRLRVEPLAKPPNLRWGETVLGEFPESGLRFIQSQTGQMVKRASIGAEGFVFNHYSRAALDRYLATTAAPLITALRDSPPVAVFCDSLEVFGSDWTPELLSEFRKRRGYDLKPLLPALVGELNEEKGRVRNDWALTLTELAEENFLQPLAEWSRRHGVKLRAQVYGTPPVTLSSQKHVDFADGEQTQWRTLSASRWASSANHILGRTVTASETWTWLRSPPFAATPLDLKAEADVHFIQGINQLIGHGWPYSPPQAGVPGWSFYAAAALNDRNPWWPVMPDLAAYLQRASNLLRQGEPAADLLLYLPVADIRARFTAGGGHVSIDRLAHEVIGEVAIPQMLDSGYNLDFVDDGLLEAALTPGRYRAIVLPNVERVAPVVLERIFRFVEADHWAFLVGKQPRLSPGYLEREQNDRAVRAVAAKLLAHPRAVFLADAAGLGQALRQAFPPALSWKAPPGALAYAHRRLGNAELYFLANLSNQPWRGELKLRTRGTPLVAWDLLQDSVTSFRGRVELEPYGSVVLLSGTAPRPPEPDRIRAREIDLSTGWEVTFPQLNRTMLYEQLRSWTEEEATRYYSGGAAYEKTVTVEPDLRQAWLEFGPSTPLPMQTQRHPGMRAWLAPPVRDAAVVYVNGSRAGSLYAPPYRVDLSPWLRLGENRLRIEVFNTNLNRMAGLGEPDYRVLAAAYGERFQMQDMAGMQPQPSGLLGQVKLVAWRQPQSGAVESGSSDRNRPGMRPGGGMD